jgi:hypothetical protein
VLHILRHMTENQNFLGLGSLWDSEVQNVALDEKREVERNRRAQTYLRDALLDLAQDHAVSVVAVGRVQSIHVRRIGMMWLDGVLCGSSDRAVVHFNAIERATADGACGCRRSLPHLFELVPFGAVLRDLERRAAEVVVVQNRSGVSGRITGVWRDALSLTTSRGRVVVPWSACGLILVTDTNRL